MLCLHFLCCTTLNEVGGFSTWIKKKIKIKKHQKLLTSYLMDSRTVCLCSAALSRICSRMMSAFSLSTLARAFDSASMRRSSFLCLRSISCSIVAVEERGDTLGLAESTHGLRGYAGVATELGTFSHGLLLLDRLLLLAKVFLIQDLLLKDPEQGCKLSINR